MTSLINPNNIDGTYPIAGQDNSSQGFRNNFTNIKNNLGQAKVELEDLQVKALLKSPLEGSIFNDDFNDLNDYPITAARLKGIRETVYDLGATGTTTGPVSGTVSVDFSNGSFQFLIANGDVTLTFTGWPSQSARHAKLRLLIDTIAYSNSRTFTFDATSTTFKNAEYLPGYININTILFRPGIYLLEFSTYDSGTTVFVNELYKNEINRNQTTGKTVVANITAYPSNTFPVTGNIEMLIFDTTIPTITTANVNLPANINLYDGQRLTIASNSAITSCNIFASGATIRGGVSRVTGFAASSSNTFVFSKTTNTWYNV